MAPPTDGTVTCSDILLSPERLAVLRRGLPASNSSLDLLALDLAIVSLFLCRSTTNSDVLHFLIVLVERMVRSFRRALREQPYN